MTLLWADGVNRTPPMCFTHDSSFKTRQYYVSHGKNLAPKLRRTAILMHLEDELAKSIVDPDDIVWLESGKQYCKETRGIIKHFMERQISLGRIPVGSLIFSDQGGAFMSGGPPILSTFEGISTAQYIPSIHHFLSPNDNKFHGVAKKIWRGSTMDRTDDIACTISLMNTLNTISEESVKGWFQKNFFIGDEDYSLEDCEAIVTKNFSKYIEKDEHFRSCVQAYFRHTRGLRSNDARFIPVSLDGSLLDGRYWK